MQRWGAIAKVGSKRKGAPKTQRWGRNAKEGGVEMQRISLLKHEIRIEELEKNLKRVTRNLTISICFLGVSIIALACSLLR